MKRKSRSTIVLMAIVLLLLLLAALSVQASRLQPIPAPIVITPQPLAQPGVVAETVSLETQAAAVAYWTREGMMAAQPVAAMVDLSTAAVDPAAAPEVTGAPEYSPSGLPSPDADLIAQQAYPADWAMAEATVVEATAAEVILADESAAGYIADVGSADAASAASGIDSPTGTSQVFTRYAGNYFTPFWTNIPYRAIGKLFFNVGTGTTYCTASSLSPNNVIVTAAHCLYNTSNNTWRSNFVFAPAFRNGSAPYGSFPTSQCRILNAWVNLSGGYDINGWARYDVAVCKVGTNSAGQTLSSAVGWLGRVANGGYTQHHHNFGYPINISSNYTNICTAESFQQTTDTFGMGCDMTQGASGGPWIWTFAPFQGGSKNYINSVNSGVYSVVKNIYGARFTSNNIVVLCNAAGC